MSLTDGIVACWSPSVRGSGYLLPDLSGRGNHGTLTNMDAGTDWPGATVRGVSGTVLDLDGINDWILTSSKGYNGVNLLNVSATAWYYRRGGGFQTILYNNPTLYWYASTSVTLYVGGGAANSRADESASAIPSNQWSFLGWSYADRVVRFFRNGVFTSTATTTAGTPNFGTTSAIGSSVASGNGGERVNGQIGEINLYQRTLADAEFLEIYRQGNGAIGRQLTGQTRRRVYGFVPATGFKAYWARRQNQIIGGGV